MTFDKFVGLFWYGAAIFTAIAVIVALVLDALEYIDL